MSKSKVKYLAAVSAAAILLSACSSEQGQNPADINTAGNNANNTVQDGENAQTAETQDGSGGESSKPEDDPTLITDKSLFPTDLYGAIGDKIEIDEITELHKYEDGGEDGEWRNASCEGFVYLAEPTGVNYNSIDNADIFNSEDNSFDGSPEESSAIYKRCKVGDEICGLTVKEAAVIFTNTDDSEQFNERYFKGGSVSFEGEKKLTGYIIILSEELYGIGGTGDVIFIPDNDSQTLPVLNYNASSAEKGVYSTRLSYSDTVGSFSYKSEYGTISCGNIDSYESSWFLGEEHNKPIKVSVTLENISISSSVDWITSYLAKIKDISF